MLSSAPPLVSVVGPKGCGKTRLLTAVLERLTAEGYRCAAALPAPGDRRTDGGARLAGTGTALVAAGETAFFLHSASPDEQMSIIGRAFHSCHIVLMEGSLQPGVDIIELVPEGCRPLCREDSGLRAVIGQSGTAAGVACFADADIAGLCEFIKERYLRPQLSAAIMAGGKSSRLGRNKALLPLGGATVIEHVLAAVSAVAAPVTLITNSPEEYGRLGISAARDLRPGCGPLSGIHAALSLAATPYVLVKSCDIPLVNREHLSRLCSSYPGHDITIFKTSRFQPLCAVYRRTCLPVLEELIDHGEYRIIDLFPTLAVRVLRTGDEQAFRSINTDEDYEIIRREFEKIQGA